MAQSLVHETLTLAYFTLQTVPNLVQRERIWTTATILEALLMLVAGRGAKSSAGVLKALAERGVAVDEDADEIPSKSGFSQSRLRLPASSIDLVRQAAVNHLRAQVPVDRRAFGYIGVALDGTHIIAPRSPTTVTEFGCPKGGTPGGHHHYPQALLVMASEVGTRLPIAADLLPWDGSEHAGARAILPHLGKDTVALMDRGFVGKKLLGELIATGSQVVLRMTTSEANSWDCVYRFLRSKATEALVDLVLPDPRGGSMTVRVRLIRRAFRRGRPRKGQKPETMVLLTTITDSAVATTKDLIDLYAQRWSVEIAFRELKTVLNLERFHARRADAVAQEIAAALLWMTLVAAVDAAVDQAMTKARGRQRWNDPRRWQIHRTLLMELLDHLATTLLDRDVIPEQLDRLIQRTADYLVRTAQRRRPDRSRPRVRLYPHGRFRKNG